MADFSRAFNLSKKQEYDDAIEVLKKTPRMAVFNPWLSVTADPGQMLSHLEKVAELAKLQHEHNLGSRVISEPPITRLEQSNNTLREKFMGWW